MSEINGSRNVKILVFIIILIIIAGIWVVKNKLDKDELAKKDSSDLALHVTEELDLEQLKAYGLPIVIDFGADSCSTCKEMAPVLKELNEELQSKAIVKFVDVWKYQNLVDGYPLSVIPTQIFIGADGKPFSPKKSDAMHMKLYSNKDTGEHTFTTHEGGMTKEELLKVLREMGVE